MLISEKVENILCDLGRKLLKIRKTELTEGVWVGTQFKSKADLFAHEFLVKELSLLDSNIVIISEESEEYKNSTRPDRYWLIDPIDGTASYANGYDGYVTQVALVEYDVPVLGVIYAPATNELYTAIKGHGVRKNRNELIVLPEGERIRLIDNYPEPKGIASKLYKEFSSCDYIESGSLSLKMIRVLEGRADVFVKDVIVRDWDFAAPIAMCNELGGTISQVDGRPFILNGSWEKKGVIVCRTKMLHLHTLSLLNSYK